jgi:hypothetical protein
MGILVAPYAVEKGKNDRTGELYSGLRGTVPSFSILITQTETMVYVTFFFPRMARQPYMGLGLLVSSRFPGHTHLRHTTVGRTPLDEGPARRRVYEYVTVVFKNHS